MYDTYNDPNRTVLNMDGSPIDGMDSWDGGTVTDPLSFDPPISFEQKYANGDTNDAMEPPILPIAQEPLPPVPAPVPVEPAPTAYKKKTVLIIAAVALGAYLLFRRK